LERAVYSLFLAAVVATNATTCGKWKGYGIEITETNQSLTVKWERYSEKFIKTISKPFGVLLEAAVKSDGTEEHYMTRQKIGDKDVLIFDRLIFFQDCAR
jgi:hypothetical protein